MSSDTKSADKWPLNLSVNKSQPPVSIVTATYNRRKFIPRLIDYILYQTYPRERLQWVIFDDGTDRIWDLLEPYASTLNIVYLTSDVKLNISEKRNKLHNAASGELIVNMDDDDYYPPERVSHAVQTLLGKKVDLVGSSKVFLYFTDDASIWEVGPYTHIKKNHSTFGTMAYTKAYAVAHKCDESKTYAEEVEFTNNYKTPLYQLDPMKVMLVICHAENTFSKHKLRDTENPLVKKSSYKLKSFIRDAKIRDFYTSLK